MKNILIAGLVSLFASAAMAHSPLELTTPADEAVLTEVPADVAMVFKQNIRLTKVTSTHAGAHAEEMDLGEQKSFATDFSMPLEGLGSGAYEIEWRGLGQDGHALTGIFAFVVE